MRFIFAGFIMSLATLLAACQGTQKETTAATSLPSADAQRNEPTECKTQRLTFQQALQKLQEDAVKKEDGAEFLNARQALDECEASQETGKSRPGPDMRQILSEGGAKSIAP